MTSPTDAPDYNQRGKKFLPLPGGPRCAERTSLVGKPTCGGLGKPLGCGEGEQSLN